MIRCLTLVLASVLLVGCLGARHAPPVAQPHATITPSASSRPASAKLRPYEVFGERYYPISDATGYRERGVASWYGGKFHGRQTANGERYDMHGLTAAHKTLPLPTWVRVTNLRNGASITVRVNDRGPFVKNRLIDLSYAAARQLDMIDNGTTLVEVEAINVADPAPASLIAAPVLATEVIQRPAKLAAAEPARQPGEAVIYVQVGAFGDQANADRLKTRLVSGGIADVRLDPGQHAGLPVYRVQIGPIPSVEAYDQLVARLEFLGIGDTHLVTE